ncbi:MAG: flagellar hook-basal body complex protein FliE [Bdellovibrionaceae bacterium]|nr:flagellar hook-basal body complex protein FliE [Pseudobdellovibrionaceae bacterium]MDW8190728.1 flagellar hook-basal body complex protein FliE [Pseudobdellovibrionaceae bacterium]
MDGLKLIAPKSGSDFWDTSHFPSSKSKHHDAENFIQTLHQAIDKVNQLQQIANRKAEEFAVGDTDNIAEVMIAMEKADIALRLMMQVRNKIIEGYQEIMKIQV